MIGGPHIVHSILPGVTGKAGLAGSYMTTAASHGTFVKLLPYAKREGAGLLTLNLNRL